MAWNIENHQIPMGLALSYGMQNIESRSTELIALRVAAQDVTWKYTARQAGHPITEACSLGVRMDAKKGNTISCKRPYCPHCRFRRLMASLARLDISWHYMPTSWYTPLGEDEGADYYLETIYSIPRGLPLDREKVAVDKTRNGVYKRLSHSKIRKYISVSYVSHMSKESITLVDRSIIDGIAVTERKIDELPGRLETIPQYEGVTSTTRLSVDYSDRIVAPYGESKMAACADAELWEEVWVRRAGQKTISLSRPFTLGNWCRSSRDRSKSRKAEYLKRKAEAEEAEALAFRVGHMEFENDSLLLLHKASGKWKKD